MCTIGVVRIAWRRGSHSQFYNGVCAYGFLMCALSRNLFWLITPSPRAALLRDPRDGCDIAARGSKMASFLPKYSKRGYRPSCRDLGRVEGEVRSNASESFLRDTFCWRASVKRRAEARVSSGRREVKRERGASARLDRAFKISNFHYGSILIRARDTLYLI